MLSLILNLEHQVLVDNEGLKTVHEFDGSFKGFAEKMKERGVTWPAPCGVAPPTFAFLCETNLRAPTGYQWVSLSRLPKLTSDDRYWKLYVDFLLGGYEPPTREIDVFSFGSSPAMAARLAHLVVKGNKRSTSGNPAALQKLGVTLPVPGLVSVITDGYGVPLCAIRTVRVDRSAFRQVPLAVAVSEGEGDQTLEDWRDTHWRYFSAEAKRLGLEFSEDTDILTEWFEVLKILGRV